MSAGCRRTAAGLFASMLLAVAAPDAAVAQEDFRNTDRGRPLLTEDAYPIEFREWEFELGGHGRLVEGDAGNGAGVAVGLKTGLLRNAQVGIEVETALEQQAGGSEFGFEGIGASLMYGLRRETWGGPALAVRADARAPGSERLGRTSWTLDLAGIVTRSFGRFRMHANGGHQFGGAGVDRDSWRVGVAVDYPVGLFSRLLMADVVAEVPADGGRSRIWLAFGTRWQASNASVIDVGLATRLDEWEAGRSNLELTIGIARAFGIGGLVTVPGYPEPVLY